MGPNAPVTCAMLSPTNLFQILQPHPLFTCPLLIIITAGNLIKPMNAHPEVLTPNHYQLDQLPYLLMQNVALPHSLTPKRMLGLHNCTQQYPSMLAKIFAYFVRSLSNSNTQEENLGEKMVLVEEMPVMSAEDYGYWLGAVAKDGGIPGKDWNQLVGQLEQAKEELPKLVDRLLMAAEQIKMDSKRNIALFVYWDMQGACFRIKGSFRGLGFEVSSLFGKVKAAFDFQEGFRIRSETVSAMLMEKLRQKLQKAYEQKHQASKINKIRDKLQTFYERDLKKMDQNLLQLKLKSNYPVLRQKRFLPIEFTDGLDGQNLVDPIISNKNKYCMFGHFTGYNSNNFGRLQNSSCIYCNIEIKEVQQNKLLMFLRSNIFNPGHSPILYCPEFNRFKIINKKVQAEVEEARKNLESLGLSSNRGNQNPQGQNQTQDESSQSEMRNQSEQQPLPARRTIVTEVIYSNYMHLCSNLKSMYPLNKTRNKTEARKQLEHINYVYRLTQKHNPYGFAQYWQPLQLCDPARGKYCTHLQFTDLRVYYSSARMQDNIYVSEAVYECPICSEEVKDSELIYLKEAVVLVKYIRKLLEPEPEDPLLGKQDNGKVDPNSIKIVINNIHRKVFVEYFTEIKGKSKRNSVEIEKFYNTLVDPYVPFSEYSLGLHRRNKKLDAVYNFGNVEPQSDTERLQKAWLGEESNILLI